MMDSPERCTKCLWMPKLADIESRMSPERISAVQDGEIEGTFVPIREHLEPYTKTHDLKIWTNKLGYRRAAPVPVGVNGPMKIAAPHPDDFISWDDAWVKIRGMAQAKAL